MTETYTPPASPSFLAFPLEIIDNGEAADKETFNKVFRPLVDALQRLKIDTDEDIGVMSALQTKLGLPVIDSSDTALPTYGSGNVLSTGESHHSALQSLDSELLVQAGKFTNIDSNVGGSVVSPGSPVYTSGKVVITDGDSHHEAIEKLDDFAAATRTIANDAATDASSADDASTNIAAKLGTGAELAPDFDWTHELLVSDGQTIKTIIDNVDRYIWANQRLADQSYARHVSEISDGLSADFDFYDTLISSSKVDGATTAAIDTFLYQATGDGTEVIYVKTLPATHSQVALIWDAEAGGGSVTFEANLIGSLSGGDFATVGSEKTFVSPGSGSGTTLVVKVTLTGTGAKLFNIGMFTKV